MIRNALFEGKKISEVDFKGAEIDGLRIMPYVGQNRPFYTVEEDVLGLEFLFSGSRNIGLKHVVNSFIRIYNIEIVPIYLGHTAFEESLLGHDDKMAQFQLQRYKHNLGINSVFQFDLFPIPNLSEFEKQTTHSAYEVCLSNMLNAGADAFWEVWDPQKPKASPYGGFIANSFCHAWSCTPSYFIRQHFCK